MPVFHFVMADEPIRHMIDVSVYQLSIGKVLTDSELQPVFFYP